MNLLESIEHDYIMILKCQSELQVMLNYPKRMVCPGSVLQQAGLSVVGKPSQVVGTRRSDFFHRYKTTGSIRINNHRGVEHSPH